MPPLNLRELNSQINAVSNALNRLDNYNKKERRYKTLYTYLFGQFRRLLVRFRVIVNSKPATRSHHSDMQPMGKKLYKLERKLYSKFPNLPIGNFMALSARYREDKTASTQMIKDANNIRLKRHEFVNYYVNDLPKDIITFKNIKSGNRAIKVNKSIYSLQSFRNLTRSAVYEVLNRHGNSILFVDPLTRQTIRRSQITPIKVKLRK